MAKIYPRGTHLIVKGRFLYDHHGIYWGWGQVTHHCGLSGGIMTKGPLEKADLKTFAGEYKVEVAELVGEPPYWGDVIERAEMALERVKHDPMCPEWAHDVLCNNCEHFAAYCVTGEKKSIQVRRFLLGPWGSWLLEQFEGATS